MDRIDYMLIKELERGLPSEEEPFNAVGRKIGISGEEVIFRIKNLKDEGAIRKISARINQRKIGIMANALVAWSVPPDWDGYDELASHAGVSHCYLRKSVPDKWNYTVYTVHHRFSREEVHEEVKKIAESIPVRDYVVMFSSEELKRVPAVRIDENGDGLR